MIISFQSNITIPACGTWFEFSLVPGEGKVNSRTLTSGAGGVHGPELPLLLDPGQDPLVEARLLRRRRTEAALGNLKMENNQNTLTPENSGKEDLD